MEPTTVTPYEQEQVEQIAAWKGRRPGTTRRTMQALRRALGRAFEWILPAAEARINTRQLPRHRGSTSHGSSLYKTRLQPCVAGVEPARAGEPPGHWLRPWCVALLPPPQPPGTVTRR